MPFRWVQEKNPYTANHFRNLQVGPETSPQQIVQQARNLTQKLANGQKVLAGDGVELDEHAINEASTKLREPRSLAEELLLVHPQAQGEDRTRMRALVEALRKQASFEPERNAPALKSMAALFWFLPAPGPEAAKLPPFESFGLVDANDPEDLALDIVFDC